MHSLGIRRIERLLGICISRAPLFAAIVGAGCSAAPLPPPPPPKPVAIETPPPPPPLAPAHWIRTGGATAVGPVVGDGTFILLGGRRAIVAKDGTVKDETSPCPEPIEELIEVPSKQGARKLVGRGRHGIYRFDDPLGPPTSLARSEVDLKSIGGAPGVVAIWDAQTDLPRLIDLETGQPAALAGLPELPLRAVAFTSAKEGAAVFSGAGLAVTTDGGATYHAATDAGPGSDALRVSGLRLRGNSIRARVSNEGREGLIDLAKASLAPLGEEAPADGEPALLRWVRVTHRDPLEAAIGGGIELPGGAAAIASHGLLARVDTMTGTVSDLVEFAKGSGMNVCTAARAADVGWVACALSEGSERDLYDPFGVMRVSLGTSAPSNGKIGIEAPSLARNGESELRASPSGGAMLVGPCNADEQGDACVRQPDGKWLTFRSDVELGERGAGPLADGRIVLLRSLFDGDEPAHEGDTAEAKSGPRAPYVAVMDPTGKEAPFAPPGFGADLHGDLRLTGYIEEDADHTVRFILDDERGPKVVVQPPGHEAAPATPVEGATYARLRGGRGVAFGHGVTQSLDGGASWSAVSAPARVAEVVSRLGSALGDPNVVVIGDVGVQIENELRLGWGPANEEKDARDDQNQKLPGGVVLTPRPAPPGAGPEEQLVCTSEGPSTGSAVLAQQNQISALLEPTAKPAKGTKRNVSVAPFGRAGVLDAIGVLEEQGPDKLGSAPATWTLRFQDPSEPLGKPRSLTGPAPKGAAWGATLRNVAASGARALFTIRLGGKYFLARTKGASFEAVEIGSDLLPSADLAFGADKGEPIAWLHDASLVVWLSGEAPRVIASIGLQATRVVGEPAQGSVPILLVANDWALVHAFPIPAAPKPSPPATGKEKLGEAARDLGHIGPPPPLEPVIAGWTAVTNVRRETSRIHACGGKGAPVKGARFRLFRQAKLPLSIDKIAEDSQLIVYDVRVGGSDACLDSVAATYPMQNRPAPPAPKPGQKPPTPVPATAKGPVGFVRADLSGKKAEGGERGAPPAQVRRLSCSLAPK